MKVTIFTKVSLARLTAIAKRHDNLVGSSNEIQTGGGGCARHAPGIAGKPRAIKASTALPLPDASAQDANA